MSTLQDVLHRHHRGAALYKHAQELVANIPDGDNCQLLIHFDAACDKRCYNEPDAASKEISIMIPEEGYDQKGSQDIIVNLRDGPLERISDCHPFYPALRYVLLFPKGQLGWQPNIPYEEIEKTSLNHLLVSRTGQEGSMSPQQAIDDFGPDFDLRRLPH